MDQTSATTTGTVSDKRRGTTVSATTGPKGATGEPAITYQVVEHMIAAAESRTDVKLVELRAHVDTLKVDLTAEVERSASGIQLELAKKPGTGAFIATVLGAMAIVVGVLAFGGDRFDGGVQVTSVSVQQAQEARDLAIENANQIRTLVDIINKRAAADPQPDAP
jgi:hypothetical protein